MLAFSETLISQYIAGQVDLLKDRILYKTDVRLGAVSASSERLGFPAAVLKNGLTNENYRPNVMPATIDVNGPAGNQNDYCAIAGHNLADTGVLVTLQASSGAGFYDIMSVAPVNNSPILMLFAAVAATTFRVSLSWPVAPTDTTLTPSIAVLYIGKSLIMERGVDMSYQPIGLSRDIENYPQSSELGGFIGTSVMTSGNSSSATWSYLSNAFYRREFDPFVVSAARYPFFFVLRPEPDLTSVSLELSFVEGEYASRPVYESAYGDLAYARLPASTKIKPSYAGQQDRLNVTIPMEGLAVV